MNTVGLLCNRKYYQRSESIVRLKLHSYDLLWICCTCTESCMQRIETIQQLDNESNCRGVRA